MNILIIGLGSIALKHISALKQIDYSISINALRSNENSSIIKGVNNFYSIDDVTLKPDFVIISNPTHLHYQAIKDSLKFSCPLLIEKPVLNKLEQSSELQKVINSKKIKTYIACNLRFHPVIKELKTWIEEAKPIINEVNVYCGSYLPDWRPGKDFRKIYSANAEMGGGVHLDLIHEIDYCYWLFGKPLKTKKLTRSNSSLKINSIDYANYQLIYANFVVNIVLNYYRKDTKRGIEIITNEQTIEANLVNAKICSSNERLYPTKQFDEFKISDTYLDQLKYYLSCIRQEEKLMNDFDEALEVLKITLADV